MKVPTRDANTPPAGGQSVPTGGHTGLLRPLEFRLCPIMAEGLRLGSSFKPHPEPSVLLEVDLQSLKFVFESGPSNTPQTQWGVEKPDKLHRCLGLIAQCSTLDAPALRLNGTETGLVFEDGRHRLAALEHLGYLTIQIGVPRCQAEKVSALLASARSAIVRGVQE